jgi:YegS/Rv2252/BmrU family lipid kinase
MYNPNSGKGKIKKRLKLIESVLRQKFSEVTMYATKSAADTRETASDSCGKYDAVIFSGGDGTFNEVLCGVSSKENRPILGYIPSGTVNDIARNLGISRRVKKALHTIVEGELMDHDVGLINDRYFMYVCAIGTFTGASYRTKQHIKKKLGKIAYAIDGIKDIISPKQINLLIENEQRSIETKAPLVLVLNSMSVGGIKFNKKGHLNDGLFDIVIVKNGITKGLFNIIKLFLFGIRQKKEHRHFIYLSSSDITVKITDDIQWCVDGEAGPKGTVRISNLHSHVQILVPKK